MLWFWICVALFVGIFLIRSLMKKGKSAYRDGNSSYVTDSSHSDSWFSSASDSGGSDCGGGGGGGD